MIKKIATITLTLLSCILIAKGQIKKKSILLGGQVFYYNSDIDYSGNQSNQKNKDAALNVSFGKAFKENSIYGLNITYSPSSVKNFYNSMNFVNSDTKQYSMVYLIDNIKN